MARFFDAKKHGDRQKQATTESDSFLQIKAQIYANMAPRFESRSPASIKSSTCTHNSHFTVQVVPEVSVEETAPCFIVRDSNGQALAFVNCEDEQGKTSGSKPADP
jgi:hypothetical protein